VCSSDLKIFDPFFTTKGKAEGTGLGLAVVHGIIKNHNGSIKVQSSTTDRQTTFEILLPAIETVDSDSKAAVHTGRENRGTILFVEDDEDQLSTTPRLLESYGFTVLPFSNPNLAINHARSSNSHINVILTDFDMPQMSGTELAARLPDLPTILISGRNDALVAARDIANIRQVIIKPYDMTELITAIATITSKEKRNG
jgi:CheY-like chemotaxis protein